MTSAGLPLIGLSTYREDASWGVWSQRADILHHEYADSVVAAGGRPSCYHRRPLTGPLRAVVARLDGVICGGADVDPGAMARTRTPGPPTGGPTGTRGRRCSSAPPTAPGSRSSESVAGCS